MSNEPHVLDLLPSYALGALDSEEAIQVEKHLLGCMICRAESKTFQNIADGLGLFGSAAVPPSDLKHRLMQRVQRAQQLTQTPRRSLVERLLPVWKLASLCLIVALAGFNLSLWQRQNRLEVNTSPGGMRAVALSGSNTSSTATGFVIISPDGRNGALVVDGLPPLDEGLQYQVWLIRDGQRTSGAVFSTDEDSYSGMRIRAPGSLLQYSAMAITIEPSGGSAKPTGIEVLSGPLLNP